MDKIDHKIKFKGKMINFLEFREVGMPSVYVIKCSLCNKKFSGLSFGALEYNFKTHFSSCYKNKNGKKSLQRI